MLQAWEFDEVGDPIHEHQMYQKEPTIGQTMLENGTISFSDAWRIATSAESPEGITMERETARAMAIIKIRADIVMLQGNSFTWLEITQEDLIVLFSKLTHPAGAKLLNFTVSIVWISQEELKSKAIELLRLTTSH